MLALVIIGQNYPIDMQVEVVEDIMGALGSLLKSQNVRSRTQTRERCSHSGRAAPSLDHAHCCTLFSSTSHTLALRLHLHASVGRDHAPGEVRSIHHFSVASNKERPCGNSGLNSSATLLAVRSSCSTRHTLALRVNYQSHPHFVCNFLRISPRAPRGTGA